MERWNQKFSKHSSRLSRHRESLGLYFSPRFFQIPDSRIGAMHKEKEDAIREAGLPGASLGAGGFMTNCFQWIGSIRADNAVFNPFGKGKVAPIAPEDIAAVAVHALTSSPVPEQILELTGDTPLSVSEQVAILAKTLGREI